MHHSLFNRRLFLRALALGAVAPAVARLTGQASADAAPRPARLFVYYVPHGVPNELFNPSSAPTSSRILEPLAPFSGQVTVVRGVYMNDGANNHGAIRATLTGFSEGAAADSIDRVVASRLGTKALALGACPFLDGSGFSSDSFLIKEGGWVAPEADPRRAAELIFPTKMETGNVVADAAAFQREAMALTETELLEVSRSVADLPAQRDKLALHLEAVRALQQPATGVPSDASRPQLPALTELGTASATDPANFGKVLDAQLELAAAALVRGTRRVVTLQCLHVNSGLSMGFSGGPGVAKGHHDPISHSWDSSGRAEFAEVQRYFYARLAERLLKALNVPDPLDPGRSVLDNSTVLCISEVSDGANHNSDASSIWVGGREQRSYLPCVLIGGGAGTLRSGRIVDVSRPHIDVLASVARASGAAVDTVGRAAASPISELFL